MISTEEMCEEGAEKAEFWDDDGTATEEKCKVDEDPTDDLRESGTVD